MSLCEVTWEQMLGNFDESVHDRIAKVARATGATHVVVFENLMLDSSQLGARTALCVGPGCTYSTPEACQGKWLNDLPSQRQHPQAFAPVPK